MKPTIGRIVHYYDEMLKDLLHPNIMGPYAAIITHVQSDTVVNLEVFPTRLFGVELTVIELNGGDRGQTRWWCWPPRAEDAMSQASIDRIMRNETVLDDPVEPDVPSDENVV